jgi:two-component system KDP operon response regulator KdpE
MKAKAARHFSFRLQILKVNRIMTRRFNVLIVDDEAALRKVLQTSLTARGFSVEEASSAEQAIDMVPEGGFDLVLLDINMPGLGGMGACRRIRSLQPGIGIVMVTVRDAEHDMVQALEAGADDYITKPIRFGELVARLHAVLRRTVAEEAPAATLQAGNLDIDFDRRLFRRDGEMVHLTPKEFDLLALLMRNQGMPLTHAKLLRAVWGPEYGKELEYLRSYVKTLRKKIEEDPAKPKYILTEPWVGYRFCDPSDGEQWALESDR